MIGFDYGTSNCAVGVMKNGQPTLLSLGEHGRFIPSTLYAPSRDVITNWLHHQLPESAQQQFAIDRKQQLQKGQSVLRELKLDGIPSELSFGKTALNNYLDEPDEGYYIKSPKSFLGTSGLVPQQIALFEDIVAAMMANVKQLTEQNLNREVTQVVIGRPVNFQGLREEESNRQAIALLTNAAKRVGYKNVEFQFEPVAAGFEFEASLTKETNVLVVDIGGGTTDCSMLVMGPKLSQLTDRSSHLLSHSGLRVGGNDFDIQLALKGIMPNLGMNSLLKTNKPMPTNSFYQAVAINNINEQTTFYSASNRRFLTELQRDAKQPELLERMLTVHDYKLSYRLVNAAEEAKVALSDNEQVDITLNDIDQDLIATVNQQLFQSASQRELNKIAELMQEAITQAQCQADVIFVTGGTAKSPILKEYLQKQLPQTPVIVGDHFGSVTSGLTRWAEKIFS